MTNCLLYLIFIELVGIMMVLIRILDILRGRGLKH